MEKTIFLYDNNYRFKYRKYLRVIRMGYNYTSNKVAFRESFIT